MDKTPFSNDRAVKRYVRFDNIFVFRRNFHLNCWKSIRNDFVSCVSIAARSIEHFEWGVNKWTDFGYLHLNLRNDTIDLCIPLGSFRHPLGNRLNGYIDRKQCSIKNLDPNKRRIANSIQFSKMNEIIRTFNVQRNSLLNCSRFFVHFFFFIQTVINRNKIKSNQIRFDHFNDFSQVQVVNCETNNETCAIIRYFKMKRAKSRSNHKLWYKTVNWCELNQIFYFVIFFIVLGVCGRTTYTHQSSLNLSFEDRNATQTEYGDSKIYRNYKILSCYSFNSRWIIFQIRLNAAFCMLPVWVDDVRKKWMKKIQFSPTFLDGRAKAENGVTIWIELWRGLSYVILSWAWAICFISIWHFFLLNPMNQKTTSPLL